MQTNLILEHALQEIFDSAWYRQHNPDVAAADLEPWYHYWHHGRFESRQPCKFSALSLEQSLWQIPVLSAEVARPQFLPLSCKTQEEGAQETLNRHLAEIEAIRLTGLSSQQTQKRVHAYLASWVLARWYASFGMSEFAPKISEYLSWLTATPVVERQLLATLLGHPGLWLLACSAALARNDQAELESLLSDPVWRALQEQQTAWQSDFQLALSMVKGIDQVGLPLRDAQISFAASEVCLDNLQARTMLTLSQKLLPLRLQAYFQRQHLVSVIIPCFNAATTIGTALSSLIQQRWPALEIIVVDDASTDDTVSVVKQWQRRDRRIRLFQQTQNQGAYAARNRGLAKARGEYFTVHDADDWSHPLKIELQVRALQDNRQAMASISHWVRCDNAFRFGRWRVEDSWVYRNISSLMCRRQVFQDLGYWDLVAVNGDTEYMRRLEAFYGKSALIDVRPGEILALGRQSDSSLTQRQSTHLRSQFEGVRKDYMEAAEAWHRSGDSLYLDANPEQRPFLVPAEICRNRASVRQQVLADAWHQSPWFNEEWYLASYPDVVESDLSAIEHFAQHGLQEGRHPGPGFHGVAYQWWQTLTPNEQRHVSFCVHHELPEVDLVLVGHLVSAEQYGAERSLIDLLRMLSRHYRVLVALPDSASEEYLREIMGLAEHVVIFPFQWWHAEQNLSDIRVRSGVGCFVQLLRITAARVVYVNTLTLWQPLLAARSEDVTSVMHVREMPAEDPSLCQLLGADADAIRTHIRLAADYFVANSKVVSEFIGEPHRTSYVPNVVAPHWFKLWPANPIRKGEQGKSLKVGMFSSNVAKKGVADFIQLAALLEPKNIDCWLVGPKTKDLELALQAWEQKAPRPSNLKLTGYVRHTRAIMAELDVVVSLSHFAESFGRSVLEALAAARPVCCYAQGALIDLVTSDCGTLVSVGDVQAIAAAVEHSLQDHAYSSRAEAARRRACAFQQPQVEQLLVEFIEPLIR